MVECGEIIVMNSKYAIITEKVWYNTKTSFGAYCKIISKNIN